RSWPWACRAPWPRHCPRPGSAGPMPAWRPRPSSDPPGPARVVGLAQAREAGIDRLAALRPRQLAQRSLQPRQVALAPGGGRDVHAAAVEVDHPALSGGVEQDVVGIEVDV